MHRARAFFYVCAGLFLLALSYHLGARNVGAQSGGSVVAAGVENGPVFSAVVGRTVYALQVGGPVVSRPPVPGTEPIIAVGGGTPGNGVILANGDAYAIASGGSWTLVGNLLGGPVPAQQESFGSLKVRYRGEGGAGQAAPAGK